MSTLADRFRARVRADNGPDAGFTLIEMVVALIVFALVAQALAGVLINGARAEMFGKLNTGAKNFTQQRIDALRSLPFHVDRQNGNYLDLLDLYYPNASASPTLIPHIATNNQKVTGVYVPSDTATAQHPIGPYYKIVIPGAEVDSANLAQYTQTIYVQFLNADDPTKTRALPVPPVDYDTTVAGHDQPVSPLVEVWVDTTWSMNGSSHTLTTVTEIADQGTDTSLLTSQAKSTAVQVLTQDYLANAITVNLGSVTANGGVSNGSSAGVVATGASVDYTSYTDPTDPTTYVPAQLLGEQLTSQSPPDPAGSTGFGGSVGSQHVGGGGCSDGWWAAFGTTEVDDVSSTTASGLPLIPRDAASTLSSTPMTSASLDATGGNACAGLWFTNQTDLSHLPDPSLRLTSTHPIVRVADLGGSVPILTGSAVIHASNPAQADDSVTAKAAATMSTWVKVFPGVTLTPALPASAPGVPGYPGLLNVQLTQASLTCETQADGTTKATLTYSGTAVWYTYNPSTGSGVWHTLPINWNGGADPLSAAAGGIDLSQPVGSDGATLSTYFTSISGSTGPQGANGAESVEATIAIGTVPILGSSYPGTAISVKLGHMSCAAQDNR